jgi:hypothetical protein
MFGVVLTNLLWMRSNVKCKRSLKSKMARSYSFFFHYNKPASRAKGSPVISIHYRGQCFLAGNIVCSVPTVGRINKRQPFFVMTGKAQSVIIKNNVAYIT